MTKNQNLLIPDLIVRLVFPYLSTSTLLALLQVSKTAYELAVHDPTNILEHLKRIPGNQPFLRTLSSRELVAVLRQRAKLNFYEANVWSNITDLAFNHGVRSSSNEPDNGTDAGVTALGLSTSKKTFVNLDAATIATIADEDNHLHSFAVLVATDARNTCLYEVKDQSIELSYIIPDPFPYQQGVKVSVAKITTWENTEPGLSILYSHQYRNCQRWSITHFPLSSIEERIRTSHHESHIESYYISDNTRRDVCHKSPLAMARASHNRCVIAWNYEFFPVPHSRYVNIAGFTTLEAYEPAITECGQRVLQCGIFGYRDFTIATQTPTHLGFAPDAAIDLEQISDLEINEDVDVLAGDLDDQVNLQIYSRGSLLHCVKVFNLFRNTEDEFERMLTYDLPPEYPFTKPVENIGHLNLNFHRGEFLLGPTIALVPLPGDKIGCIDLVSPHPSPDNNAFLAGSFFYRIGDIQNRYSKLLVKLLGWPSARDVCHLGGRIVSTFYDDNPNRLVCRIAVADGTGVRIWSVLMGHFIKTSFETELRPKRRGDVEDEDRMAKYVRHRRATASADNNDDTDTLQRYHNGDSYTTYFTEPRDNTPITESDYPHRFRFDSYEMVEHNIVGVGPTRLDAGGKVLRVQVLREGLLVLTDGGVRYWGFGEGASGKWRGFGFEGDGDEDGEDLKDGAEGADG
ncbi:MAG: hypothetical protein Q9160_006111 [Pyrenula sp. 1 TL-2023]